MRVIIQTSFDVGRSYGIDDSPFEPLKRLNPAQVQRLPPFTFKPHLLILRGRIILGVPLEMA